MKNHLICVGTAVMLALFVTGCETDGGVSARAQEKSAVYAALKPWQKKYIAQGSIAQGFTPDMVYIAMGHPDKVETQVLPEGKAELWTYRRFYPNVDAVHGFQRANFTTESAYQPQRATMQSNGAPVGMSRNPETISKTGGPQGGSMEPADLRSYTIKVLFAGGTVVRIGADQNPTSLLSPMKICLIPAGAALLLALFVTGCESDGGVSARSQEKSAVYASLKPWQKKYIDKGSIALGFTPDMVYIAMGRADKVETKDLPEGKSELWTYGRYYPSADALSGYQRANFTAESAYQPQQGKTQTDPDSGKTVPMGMAKGGADTIGRTGGPQGGSLDLAELTSYTIKVLLTDGKVVRIGADRKSQLTV